MKKLMSMILTASMLLCAGVTAFADDSDPILANNPLTDGTHTVSLSTGEDSGTGITPTGVGSIEVNDGATVTYSWDVDSKTGTFTVNGITAEAGVTTVQFTVSEDSPYYPRAIHVAGDETEVSSAYEINEDKVFVLSYGHIGTPVEYTVYCQTADGKTIGNASGYTMKGYAGETIPVPAPEINGYKLKTSNPQITLKLIDAANPGEKNEITLIYAPIDTYQEITETVIIPGGSTGGGSGTGTNSGTTIEDESTPQGDNPGGNTNSGSNSGAVIGDNSIPLGPGPNGGSGMTKYIPVAAGGIGILALLALLAKKKKEEEDDEKQAQA